MESIEIRKEIAKHLALSDKLEIARKEVVEKDLPLDYVAEKYGLDYQILYRKIDIIRRKKEFYKQKQKFDAARKKIIEGNSTFNDVAKSYGIIVRRLHEDVQKARAQENYEYDRKINRNHTGFTYLQEESLLKILKDWAIHVSSQNLCSCQLCALEQLLTLAYEFSQQNNIKCSSYWDTFEQASIEWLIDFEMRYSDEISDSFDSLEKCLKQIQADE